ncbi:MAG: hypothetical protein R2695_13370 [Acidimicrobiales bacterium]
MFHLLRWAWVWWLSIRCSAVDAVITAVTENPTTSTIISIDSGDPSSRLVQIVRPAVAIRPSAAGSMTDNAIWCATGRTARRRTFPTSVTSVREGVGVNVRGELRPIDPPARGKKGPMAH